MTDAIALKAELDLLTEAADEAAKLALSYFRNGAKSWIKGASSPVTEADIAIDEMLRERLIAARPGYGFLSEESPDDGTRLSSARTFVVDPIDGTRAFIAGTTDWTVPIALVEDGRPIVSVVIAPARDEVFQATKGEGASRGGSPIRVSAKGELEGARLAVSKRLLQSKAVAAPINAQTVFYASLAYRLAQVADGRLDGAAIKPNARDWDLAAVDLLVHEAGGFLANIDGSMPRYDRETTRHGAMVAGTGPICTELRGIVEKALALGV